MPAERAFRKLLTANLPRPEFQFTPIESRGVVDGVPDVYWAETQEHMLTTCAGLARPREVARGWLKDLAHAPASLQVAHSASVAIPDFDNDTTLLMVLRLATATCSPLLHRALVVGDARRVTAATWALFRDTGTIHLPAPAAVLSRQSQPHRPHRRIANRPHPRQPHHPPETPHPHPRPAPRPRNPTESRRGCCPAVSSNADRGLRQVRPG